ncbi:helicase protein MOM1-like isoform X2 [Olea europaea var. sylvestris]|uniref:helicase protein MOM1-like isoform X2 n=1 Tax=Olea europaea var. sylvestris TaxID=158386 RepID=UPI000C1D6A55|nr:helicase protein MOM1-like isoform X2 [Olea europaea var. sylvestris]
MHYVSVHSLLDPKYEDVSEDISHSDTNLDGHVLKENLSHFVAYECKSNMPSFVEYWVPVRLSNVQTEQYCASLFSNSMLLCSGLKCDSVHALQEILISTMKCCDHPYLVDRSLRNSVVEGIPVAEQLNAEIELSGKLNLLHMILPEIKKRELRVLILFQSLVGPGLISIGDILDDIIHEKFGEDSYVRIGGGMPPARKRAALSMFNDKGNRKFVCLMETRSCITSIKLSSIDTVILLNSDWDPMNDLRALHKINLTSDHEQLKIFRIYSSFTLEEKILILAKQGMNPQGNLKNIKQSTCHGLLAWGASYLFQKLHEFHDLDSHSSISSGETFIEDVCHELITVLPNSGQSNDSTNCSFILKVLENGGIYPRNMSLIGEVESSLMGDFSIIKDMIYNEPHVFWINLLNGRNPRWKYLSSPSSRAIERGKCLNDLPEDPEGKEKNNKCRKDARSTANRRCPAGLKHRVKKKLRAQYKKRKISVLQHPCNSSVQYSVTDKPPQLSSNMPLEKTGAGSEPIVTNLGSTNASLSSGNNDPPEADRLTYSEAQQSVCLSLQRELERLQKYKDENIKLHDDMKVRLKLSLEEEIDQMSRKYDLLLQIAETEFEEKKLTLETSYNNVYINKVLAETLMQNQDVTDATCSQEMPSADWTKDRNWIRT